MTSTQGPSMSAGTAWAKAQAVSRLSGLQSQAAVGWSLYPEETEGTSVDAPTLSLMKTWVL